MNKTEPSLIEKKFYNFLKYHQRTKPIAVKADIEDGVIELSALAVKTGTSGYGSIFMAKLINFSEKHRIPINIEVIAHNGWQFKKGFKRTVKRDRLLGFYDRFMFQPNGLGGLEYSPYSLMMQEIDEMRQEGWDEEEND